MITVGEMSSTTLENCIRYFNPDEHELSMVFNFHHLQVDYKGGDKWSLIPADIPALKKAFRDVASRHGVGEWLERSLLVQSRPTASSLSFRRR